MSTSWNLRRVIATDDSDYKATGKWVLAGTPTRGAEIRFKL